MPITLAFDVYGTLIDTHGVVVALSRLVGEKAAEFSRVWREKQLEYSFRRALMQNYEDFAVCTRQALDYTNTLFGSPLGEDDKDDLMAVYRVLPAFADVQAGLATAKRAGFRMFAFSNGQAEVVDRLLLHAGIRDYFMGIVSVDDLKSYKPNPGVYAHFLRQAGVSGGEAWLVSGNPFDLIGAVSAGMRAAWIRRSPEALFDPWGIEPTLVVDGLEKLADGIAAIGPAAGRV